MGFMFFIHVLILLLIYLFPLILAQQPYARKATTNCTNTDKSTSVLGYTCNDLNPRCQSYLIFRSQPPHNTVSSISNLLSSDSVQLSQINSVSVNATFETNKLVIVPINCSCSGEYYQANTSYVIEHENTYFLIANNTFQGLSTCQAIQVQNTHLTRFIYSGTKITVPIRCACPTKNQTDVGVKYLLSYLVTWGDSVSSISARFGVDTGMTLEANGLSEQDYNIYPFTTLLIPLQNQPSNSQTIEAPPPPQSPPPPSPPLSSNKSSNKAWVYVLIGSLAGGSVVFVIAIIVFCAFFSKTNRRTEADTGKVSESFGACEKPTGEKVDEKSQEFLDSISSMAPSLKLYSFGQLQSATDNFSTSCRLEESIYRGKIDEDWAAIKIMNGDVSKEINLLNKINHFNLISLSGVCYNDGHWYLVYEFAVNGSLSNWIYYNNSDHNRFLNWTQRVQIALDVATGLSYLHEYTTPPHVHSNIKSSNVLLDSDFRAKIANFGLVRSVEGHESQFALTRHIVGTKGYMAPEYLENGLVSPKLDVYAFGILLMEMLTGKEAAVLYGGESMHLSDVVIDVLQNKDGKETFRDFIDPSLQENCPLELAILLVRLIQSCLNKDPACRPGMKEIVPNLSRILSNSLNWEMSINDSRYQSSN